VLNYTYYIALIRIRYKRNRSWIHVAILSQTKK